MSPSRNAPDALRTQNETAAFGRFGLLAPLPFAIVALGMSEAPPKPARRPRYRGTHPRRFHEKYKELSPEKYPETVRKVLASGKTPAGAHRPICVSEILEALHPQPGELAVDATLGYGGHARELLNRILPGGRLIALDVDPLELPKTEARLRAGDDPGEALSVHAMNFAGLARLLGSLGVAGADIVLADLGCSSMQLDNPERGFSYKLDGPLDLRLNPAKGRPASKLLENLREDELASLLSANADEPLAAPLARILVSRRQARPLTTTGDLAEAVRVTLRQRGGRLHETELKHTLARVFQALRVEVNDEFGALETFLRFLPGCLRPGGRVAVLTFHSGEDRRVKKYFLEGLRAGVYASIAQEVVRPSAAEVHANPRAASAKLRWALKSP